MCKRCQQECGSWVNQSSNNMWKSALMDIPSWASNRPIWVCPKDVKQDSQQQPFPPVECPYRVELLILKDQGHKTPETCY